MLCQGKEYQNVWEYLTGCVEQNTKVIPDECICRAAKEIRLAAALIGRNLFLAVFPPAFPVVDKDPTESVAAVFCERMNNRTAAAIKVALVSICWLALEKLTISR